ncbi:MAG: DNA polymerase [Clostridia bacterium]
MKRQLSIDIETYSSVDIKKSGLFKYVQSPDFQILLLAYSLDGGEVKLIDLTENQARPWAKELVALLLDPDYIKHAYNATFEWYCLSKWMGLDEDHRDAWLSQWRCSMLHGLYCGYPAGLGAVGKALGLPEDKQKDAAGKALIKCFCCPCKPSKVNGGRTRNLPHHDPEKWHLFGEYCRQDVVTEMATDAALAAFPVPERTQNEWEVDQRINARGVAADLRLMDGALWCGEIVNAELMAEAIQISGLDNPNSLPQLKKWLEEETETEICDLKKETVSGLLGEEIGSDAARRMLEIRQLLGKTSTKKYNAMEAAVCDDGRVRGLLQFYGANRTGRWAGRLVQVQNLPRTYVEPLALARELVTARNLPALQLCYGSIPDTLSQLIRTALVAAPGHIFIDADYSAIEARVIAWLAGEQWRLEVFKTHGKIYEASASQMFGVPLELIKKGNPEYALRQRGKVAELALGYQGGANALTKMDTAHALTDEEKPGIVKRWRQASPKIVELWNRLNDTAIDVILTGRPQGVNDKVLIARECHPKNGLDFLTVQLPSGRKLYYPQPTIATNRWGNPSIGYMGMDQTSKKWRPQETYGGKLTENIVQAIARDCLAKAITRLEDLGFPVVFHVHDEVVIDCPAVPDPEAVLESVCKIMSEPMPWAPDLPLNADGWFGDYFRKD